jgi:hypothetical protein
MVGKNSSQRLTGSGVLIATPGYYHGFTVVTNGLSDLFRAWDSPTTAAGTLVENFQCDGSKTTDGHEHATPVYCASGIYYGVPNGMAAIIYFYQFPLQKG